MRAWSKEIRSLGWQGKVLPFDEADIEHQNALVFVDSLQGKQRTVVKMKVRPEAEQNLLRVVRQTGIETEPPARVGQRLPEDVFADDILAAVKTVNHHASDGQYNQETIEKAASHLAALRRLRQHEDPDVKEMATTLAAVRDKAPIDELFNAYLKKRATPRRRPKNVPFTVRRTKVLQTKRQIRGGELVVVNDAADNNAMFNGQSINAGEQYEIDFGDGVRAVYRPSSERICSPSGVSSS